ncbi:MAG: DUF1554 domain-containing protein [Myxococcota bacterium]
MQRLSLGLAGVLVAGLAWAGCSASDEVFDDDGDPTSTSPSSSASTGGGDGSGGAGEGGAGAGTTNPCGQDCSAIATPDCFVSVCNTGQAAGPIGSCVVVPDEDGASCDDGLFCTTNDTCQAGVCTGGPPNDCGMMAAECEEITCDETARSCGSASLANGTSCTSPNLCEIGGTCQNGLCIGVPNDCFFSPVPNECFNAVCNPQSGMCEPVAGNDGDACIDINDLCSEGNTCSAGVCSGGSPKDCSGFTMGCFNGVCDTQTGQCGQQPVPAGGNCAAASDDCNQGICDMQGMCNPNPVNEGGACDTDACFSSQTCNSGTCQGGTFLGCGTDNDGCCPSGCTISQDNDCLTEITMATLNNGRDGNLGGIAGADALCQAQASAAGFTGTWKAFLSDATQDVKDIVPSQYQNLPVRNSVGTDLWTDWNQVFVNPNWQPGGAALRSFDGKIVDENTGASPDWNDADGWHGSTPAGVVDGTLTCSNWTSTTGTGRCGELDLSGGPFGAPQEIRACNLTLAVICVLVGP